MAKTIVGLEVTEESVRAAEITLGRKPQLVTYGEVPLPPDAARDSEVLDVGSVAVALRQLWTGARFKSRNVVLGVASRRILVREYTTQAMRPDLMREALPYQVQDLLPVPASQSVLDFYPLSQEGDQVSGLLVAAVSENIEQIVETLSRVKVRVRAVDLTAFGLARVSARLTGPDEVVSTVFVGDHTTQFAVSRGGVPLFVRLLPIDVATSAGRRQTAQTVEANEPALAYANSNVEVAMRTRGASRAASSPGVADLAARLRSTLAFYASRPAAQPVTRMFVTGAGAAADGVLTALNSVIDVPIQVVSVDDIITTSSAPAGELGLNLVGTVGIALGEVGR
ncbi:hypothetical protein GCM10022200_01700 [Microbacterium awajiense]|uniref:Type IV pilus assembly protein PilM n=1 Tax=Microbacterium awajiense TaxID=415214 RepID=A0ABP7A187_9MICO